VAAWTGRERARENAWELRLPILVANWQFSLHNEGMKTSIDRFGRVAVPKTIRDQLGWAGGSPLLLEVSQGALRLTALDGDLLRVEDGVLVYTGAPEGDLGDAVGRSRRERLAKVKRGG
jgi:AbrB family looped-hinge helix DNA binding protein